MMVEFQEINLQDLSLGSLFLQPRERGAKVYRKVNIGA